MTEEPSSFSYIFEYKAAPKAPIRPEISGLITLCPISRSKLFSTASFKKVPPCTTMFSPSSDALDARITLYMAFLTTLSERPADMSETSAPSFCACFTEEFINTVHLVPRLTGFLARSPNLLNSETLYPMDFANVSINEPQPEEHASLSIMLSIAPFLTRKHFMS